MTKTTPASEGAMGRIYLPCCPDFNGTLPCKGCDLDAHKLEREAHALGVTEGRELERQRIREAFLLHPDFGTDWMNSVDEAITPPQEGK